MSDDPIRFEVLKNGKTICIAGTDLYGVTNINVLRTKRDPQKRPQKHESSKEKWSKPTTTLHVGGYDSGKEETLKWYSGDLQPGDEITIKVLSDGEIDDPVERIPREFMGEWWPK